MVLTERVFLSGRFDTDAKLEKSWLQRTGCKYRCFSFAYLDPKSEFFNERQVAALKVCEDKKISIMLDSGAFSLHRISRKVNSRTDSAAKYKDANVEEMANAAFKRYSKFVHEHRKKWTFYLTLDWKKNQPIIYAMQERFRKIGLNPTPVFHGDEPLDWLDKYHDLGCKLICVGTSSKARNSRNQKSFRYYLDQVFNKADKLNLDLHGLAITSLAMMRLYPWWSVDSTTWTKTAGFGNILYPNVEKNTIEAIHVSERKMRQQTTSYNRMNKKQRNQIEDHVKELGFEFKAIRTDMDARQEFNGYVYSNLNRIGLNFDKVEDIRWQTLL